VKTVTLRGALAGLTGCVAALLLAAAPALGQNPTSDNVVFLHGLFADQSSWQNAANRLAQEFRFTPYRYSIPYLPPEAQQAQTLTTDLTPLPSNVAAVAKSNGALVLRTYLLNPGKINRFITVAGPNRGAPLTDNVLSGRVFRFPSGLASDLSNAVGYYATYDPNLPPILTYGINALQSMFNFFRDILRILSWYGFVLSAASNYAPVALDLSPSSAAVQNLNSATSLQRVATNASARAYIAADFGPPRDILFYTLLNHDAAFLSDARWSTFVISLSLYSHYSSFLDPSDPNYFVLRNGAYLWGNVANDMYDIDPYWLDMIGVFHVAGNGVPSNDSSDGIVPVTSAVLLGSTRSFRTGPTSHQILNDDPGVYQDLRSTLSSSFNIPARTTPVNSVTVSPSSVSVGIAKTAQLSARANDVLGNVVTGRPTTWRSANPAIASVSTIGLVTGVQVGTTNVSAGIDGYSAASTIIVTAVTGPPLSVVISGPTGVVKGTSHTWTSTVANGTAPYSYQWKRNGTAVATSASFTGTTTVCGPFTLTLTVTDAQAHTATASFDVDVTGGSPPCAV
jgi:pimeloyl-ACP methyl ester carboxylesterase